jgi:hypothetical protein
MPAKKGKKPTSSGQGGGAKGSAKAASSQSGGKIAAGKQKRATKQSTKRVGSPAAESKSVETNKKPPAEAITLTPTSNVLVVNMIPKSLSGEFNQDSEPHLTVNPANPLQIVGTAFTPDPTGGANAPVYVSKDGGQSWSLNMIVPSVAHSKLGTFDITTSFSGTSAKLYSGILRDATANLEFLRTTDFSSTTAMSVLASRPNADQPFTHATTVKSGTDKGKERIYIGENDTSQSSFSGGSGQTATIDLSLNAGINQPAFNAIRLEKRTTAGQNGPQVRPISHTDGTVYAAFYGWRSMSGNFKQNSLTITSADVVVVRDDKGGTGPNPFTDLKDPSDQTAGIRVVQGISFPFMKFGTSATGQQRLGGCISIAVDPMNSSTVYLAWCDKQPNSMLTLHVRRSLDRGKTWSSSDLLTIESATNAALAINSKGKIAILFQQFRGLAGDPRWVTRLKRTTDGINWDDLILSNVSATLPGAGPNPGFDPYIGDYAHLVAVDKDFYGIFSAGNIPDMANFPSGVKFQRNANFTSHKLFKIDNTTPVPFSIDPYFVKVTEP